MCAESARAGGGTAVAEPARMSRAILSALVVVFAAACGDTDQPEGPNDWAGKPLDVAVEGKVKGVAFTVRLPKGMEVISEDDSDESRTWRGTGVGMEHPHVRISYDEFPSRTLRQFIETEGPGERVRLVKKEEVAGGFLIAFRSKSGDFVGAQLARTKGPSTLECVAFQGNDEGRPVPRTDKAVEWMARVCSTLEIKE
jgi:hypothetical protein